jgi:predicted DNA-binding protein
MTLAVRLDAELERELEAYCARAGIPKSQAVKESLREYLAHKAAPADAYTIGAELFGRWGGGDADRSITRKAVFRETVRAKHARR